jgi:hypothetical protein
MFHREDFIGRVYKTSTLVGLIFVGIFLVAGAFEKAIGLAIGVVVALIALWALEVSVKALTHNDVRQRSLAKVFVVSSLKYVGLGVLFYYLARADWISIGSFAGGIMIPQGVIFLKALGDWLTEGAREGDLLSKSKKD